MTSQGLSLAAQVRAAFTIGGVLNQATDEFAARSGQRDMAMAVADRIEQGGALVVEAGTGVGKTFAYLVPALLSGARVMVSTATKALQDQLFARDLPRLIKALGLPVRTALLKGRSSYLCLHRMDIARSEVGVERANAHTLAKVERWAQVTRTGDLAELPGLDERSPIIPLVTSTRENCLGSQCPKFKACHVNLARREALACDVVVVNHHLFFADLAVRESGMAELLPTVRVAIFDEAHQLNETGVQFLGRNLTTGHLLDFARDMLAAGLQLARGLADWQALVSGVERSTRELRLVVGKQAPNTRLRWQGSTPDGLAQPDWETALADLGNALSRACEGLATVSELAPDFVRLHERASQLHDTSDAFGKPCAVGAVRWLDVGMQLRLVESPLDIADTVRKRLLGQGTVPVDADAEARQQMQQSRSWIFTSATLGDDDALSWFTEPCGLQEAQILHADSPFDYAVQAAVYVPRHLPRPNDPAHSAGVAALAARAVQTLGGRTMVLTTTLRALRTIGDALHEALAGSGIDVLVQGAMPKRELVQRFRAADGASTTGGPRGCVLVASASFWEGIDVPGDALQMVIIDKLPFPPPGDPLVEARAQRLEQTGRNAFNDYFVPEAAVSLKQGAGRLIRRETDKGLLVLCDTRLVQMGYGKRLMNALPGMRRLAGTDEFEAELAALAAHNAVQAMSRVQTTTASTTDHWST
jgi:ATP-dependent DNA helicase DinG